MQIGPKDEQILEDIQGTFKASHIVEESVCVCQFKLRGFSSALLHVPLLAKPRRDRKSLHYKH
jgi:hypothetical protein